VFRQAVQFSGADQKSQDQEVAAQPRDQGSGEEILERLRRKYVKTIPCPQCGQKLDARVAVGVGGMACPSHHGAWADREALEQLHARLENAAAIHPVSLVEKVFEIVEELHHKHRKRIDCPDCGTQLAAQAALARARRDWPGWPARMVTARGSIRVCSRKFANVWTPPQDHPGSLSVVNSNSRGGWVCFGSVRNTPDAASRPYLRADGAERTAGRGTGRTAGRRTRRVEAGARQVDRPDRHWWPRV
jgi:Zn-finger nucleic acid-binding protein